MIPCLADSLPQEALTSVMAMTRFQACSEILLFANDSSLVIFPSFWFVAGENFVVAGVPNFVVRISSSEVRYSTPFES